MDVEGGGWALCVSARRPPNTLPPAEISGRCELAWPLISWYAGGCKQHKENKSARTVPPPPAKARRCENRRLIEGTLAKTQGAAAIVEPSLVMATRQSTYRMP